MAELVELRETVAGVFSDDDVLVSLSIPYATSFDAAPIEGRTSFALLALIVRTTGFYASDWLDGAIAVTADGDPLTLAGVKRVDFHTTADDSVTPRSFALYVVAVEIPADFDGELIFASPQLPTEGVSYRYATTLMTIDKALVTDGALNTQTGQVTVAQSDADDGNMAISIADINQEGTLAIFMAAAEGESDALDDFDPPVTTGLITEFATGFTTNYVMQQGYKADGNLPFDGVTAAPNGAGSRAQMIGFLFQGQTPEPGGAPAPPAGRSATNFNCECDCGPANKTLAAYRRDLLIRCGFAAIANNPPPGTTELMDAFLRDAQNFLYLKYPALHTKRFFRWTMTPGERFYGVLENDDSTQPRIDVSFDVGVDNAIEVTWNGYEAPATNRSIFLTTEEGEALPFGLLPNTLYFVVNPASGVSNLALTPGGTAIAASLGADTSATSHGYAEIRQAIFDLAPYADIEGAWLVDLNGSWLPMTCGIPPTFYTTVSQPGLPVRYEIRSCIEVFPAPAAAYSLYIKGHFGLRPFELDSDKPTIDGHLVYLWALANALDYYGKPSAAGIATQAQDYLGQLVAGTHTGKRYVPGMRPLPPAIIPIFAPWPGGDP